MKETWKKLAAERRITAADMAALALFKAFHHNTNPKFELLRRFNPITRPKKLENGHYKWEALRSALGNLNAKRLGLWTSEYFMSLDEEMQNKIREYTSTVFKDFWTPLKDFE